jgi:uncharacterized protein (DUF488 family)
MATFFTIGHSTRDLAEFSAVLQHHQIETLVDIRAFPMSRRLPHFNRDHLELWLPEVGVEYVWMKELGGRRRKITDESPHVALRSESFRNYADYTLTPEFRVAIARLLEIASRARTAYMCAELLYFRCHRMIVSDYLVAHGHEVFHIQDLKPPKKHELMKDARVMEGELIYRGDRLL